MPLHLQYEDIRRGGIAARPGLGRRSRLIALAERSAAVVLILAVVLFWLASPNWRSLLSASPPSPTPILIHNSDPSLPLPIAWSSDSLHVAIPRDDGSVEVWDSATGERISTYHYYPSRVISVVWISASYFLVASEMPNRTVRVWNTPSEAVLFTTPPLPGEATVAAWSPNGEFIAFDGGDNSVQVWNINTGKLVQVYTQQKNRVAGLAWSPDSQQIASIGYDQTIQVWDATTGQQSMPSFVYGEAFTTLAWSPLQRSTPSGTIASIALAMLDGTVEIWDTSAWTRTRTIPPDQKGQDPTTAIVTALAWSADGTMIARSTADGSIQVFNAATGDIIKSYQNQSHAIENLAWAPDGAHIASASVDGTVQVESMPT